MSFYYDIATSVEDHIVSDSKKLKHILINLISNSINASNDGTIHILADNKSKRKDILNFTIFDEGNSMSKEQIDHFNNTQIADFDKVSGIVICKKLLDIIGRDLKYEANIPKGTKVSFSVKKYDEVQERFKLS